MRRTWLLAALLALAAGCGQSHPPTPTEQGMSLMRSGSYGEAIDAFSEAIRLNPRDAQAYLFRGRAYQCRNQSGDLDAAIGDFSSSIRFNPDDSEAYYSRAIAYRDRGTANKSKEDAAKSRLDDLTARRLDGQTEFDDLAETDTPLPPPTPLPFATTSTTTVDEDAAKDATKKAAEPKDAEAAEAPESTADLLRRLESEAAEIENNRKGTQRPRAGSAPGETRRSTPSREAGAAATGAVRNQRRAATYKVEDPRDDLTHRRTDDDLLLPVDRAPGERPITEYDTPRRAAGSRAPRYSSEPLYGAGGSSRQVPGTESAVAPPVPQYRSPFPQRPPNPTGFNRMQGIEGTGVQPRPYYTAPPPGRVRDDLR
jgi:hypothetical protein